MGRTVPGWILSLLSSRVNAVLQHVPPVLREVMVPMIFHIFRRLIRLSVESHRRSLRLAYNTAQRQLMTSSFSDETVNDSILKLGTELKETVVAEYCGKYSKKSFRILFCRPASGVGILWFLDLARCLQHTGVAAEVIDPRDPSFREKWIRFGPNVLIAIDSIETLTALDLAFIADYKRARGCLRLFTPVTTHRFPLGGFSLEDRTRLAMASAGKSADAYFSMMETEFFQLFFAEWVQRGFRYFSIPCAANPFRHFPVQAHKDLDYAVVTSCSAERIRVSHEFLLPIIKQYHGIWAGNSWGFGAGVLAGDQLNGFYARARIAPAPLLRFLRNFPCELSERAFSGPACGGFLLTNPTPITAKFFDKDELAVAPSPREFCEAFAYYASNPDDRTRFVLRGMRKVFTQHTYFHRIDRLIDVLTECEQMF